MRIKNFTLRFIIIIAVLFAPLGLVLAQGEASFSGAPSASETDPSPEDAASTAEETGDEASGTEKPTPPKMTPTTQRLDREKYKEQLPWLSKNHKECGQACIYQRANDNLILQVLYLQ